MNISFLGTVDMRGNSYTGNHLATGFGHHLAIPLLRKHWKPDMTKAEVLEVDLLCLYPIENYQGAVRIKSYCFVLSMSSVLI